MNARRSALAGALCASALAACGRLETHEIVLRPPSPPTQAPAVYFGATVPPQPFYDVALVQVIGSQGHANAEDITGALVARGAQLGCDALVRTRIDQGVTRADGVAVCVRFSPQRVAPVEPSPSLAPPASAAPPPPRPPSEGENL